MRSKVLIVSTHVIQYRSHVFSQLSMEPEIELEVAFCSLQGLYPGFDPGFQKTISWDTANMNGFSWISIKNFSPWPRLGTFFGQVNLGLFFLILKKKYDLVVTLTGYHSISYWVLILASKISRVPVAIFVDSTGFESQACPGKLKTFLKKMIVPIVLKLNQFVLVPSSKSKAFVTSTGINGESILLSPYVVDNNWWLSQANKADVASFRKKLGIPKEAIIILFSGKLQDWKCPGQLLEAFSRIESKNVYLVFAGEGPLKKHLRQASVKNRLENRTRFLGFQNQSELPAVYKSSDILVLPSSHEPFGLVTIEALLCNCVVVVSDKVGAQPDIIKDKETGFVYPSGDIEKLVKILNELIANPETWDLVIKAGHQKISTWSAKEWICSIKKALAKSPKNLRNHG